MFPERDRGVERTDNSVFYDAGYGQRPTKPAQMNFHRQRPGIGGQAGRGQWRLGGNLLIHEVSCVGSRIRFGNGHSIIINIQ